MDIELLYQPSYTLGLLKLAGGEKVRVEAGSLVSFSDGVTIETGATGGLLASLGRSLFGGESFFQNTFTAPAKGGQVTIAPSLPGDVLSVSLQNEALMIQSGSYLASELGVNLETKWSGAKTFFASEGLILLRASGAGKVVLSSYGAIHSMNLAAGEKVTIDTGHLVAFSEKIGFKVRAVGGVKSTLFSGEGLVVDLTGPGRVLMQTRSQDQFLSWLIPQLPFEKDTGGGK